MAKAQKAEKLEDPKPEPENGQGSEVITPTPDNDVDLKPSENANSSALADTLIGGMQPASPDAMATIKSNETPQTGEPVPDAPVKRGRGRPPGSGNKKSKVNIPGKGEPVNVADTSQAQVAADQTAAFAMTAGTMTSFTIMLGTMIGGEDFAPAPNPIAGGQKDDKFLYEAYFNYARAKNMGDMPPGIALFGAILVYIAPRMSKPTTQSRVNKLTRWAGEKIGGMFRRRKTINGTGHAPQPDIRNDGQRQNYAV